MNKHYPAYCQRNDIDDLTKTFLERLKYEYEQRRSTPPMTKPNGFYAAISTQEQAFFEISDIGDARMLRHWLEESISAAAFHVGFQQPMSVALLIDKEVSRIH